jgi:hypothetical protein
VVGWISHALNGPEALISVSGSGAYGATLLD